MTSEEMEPSSVPDHSAWLRLDERAIVLGRGQGMGHQPADAVASLGAAVSVLDGDGRRTMRNPIPAASLRH